MEAAVLDPASPRWMEFLERTAHDFHHLPWYVALCAERDGGTPLAVLVAGEGAALFLPLILRALPDHLRLPGVRDATSPYGYPGPLGAFPTGMAEDARQRFVGAAAVELRHALRRLGAITAFIRGHPLLQPSLPGSAAIGEVVEHGSTVAIDLTRDEEAIRRDYRDNHRGGIAKSQRRGHTVAIDADWERIDAFAALYGETMRRVGAADGYRFDRGYFLRLRHALGGRLHLALAMIGDRVAAGGLFSGIGGIVQYHLGGTFDEFMPLHPHKLLLHHVALWAKARGDRVFHLGGGFGGGDDSLFHYKAGFSSWHHPFRTWRMVIDADASRLAEERWREIATAPASASDHFFPTYRRPVA